MANKIIVANWKKYGTVEQVRAWIKTIAVQRSLIPTNLVIVICPSVTALASATEFIRNEHLAILVGAQDISRFEEEKHTGEVPVSQLIDHASYVIIGHSERRNEFNETDEIIKEKVTIAKKYGLKIIVCISDINQVLSFKKYMPAYSDFIAYEPLSAIGTGNPDTPENADKMATDIAAIYPNAHVIYGGSVDGTNVKSFLNQEHITGVLIGNRSLYPSFFLEVIKNAR